MLKKTLASVFVELRNSCSWMREAFLPQISGLRGSTAAPGSVVNCWISALGQSMFPWPSLQTRPPPAPLALPLFLTHFLVIFSDQWRREKNQWGKVITWPKIQRRPEARPATWVPFHASAAATQTRNASLYSHLKQQELHDAAHPWWPIPPQRKLPDCTAAHRRCLPNSRLLICTPTLWGCDSGGLTAFPKRQLPLSPLARAQMPSVSTALWYSWLMKARRKGLHLGNNPPWFSFYSFWCVFISQVTRKSGLTSDPCLHLVIFGEAFTTCTLLPLAARRGKWAWGHSGWQEEGATGGYLLNNDEMQMAAHSERPVGKRRSWGRAHSWFRGVTAGP